MKSANFTCTLCPLGCEIAAEYTEQGLLHIEGNGCEKGVEFVRKELYSPERILTTTIRVSAGGELPLVSVRTTKPIPKGLLFEAMEAISKVEAEAPVKRGDILVKNILSAGAVNVIATRDVKRLKE